MPKSKKDFWKPKLLGNKTRDAKKLDALIKLGWQVLVIWECETKNEAILSIRIRSFLNDGEDRL